MIQQCGRIETQHSVPFQSVQSEDDKDNQCPSCIAPPAGNMKGYGDVTFLKRTCASGKCCLSKALKQTLSFEPGGSN